MGWDTTDTKSPCYGCMSNNASWRGPRVGWMCLNCFCTKVEPFIHVVRDGDPVASVRPDEHMPVLRHHRTPESERSWTLHILDEEAQGAVETITLRATEDAVEEAVDEAKFLLEQRAWRKQPPT